MNLVRRKEYRAIEHIHVQQQQKQFDRKRVRCVCAYMNLRVPFSSSSYCGTYNETERIRIGTNDTVRL